MSLAIVTPPAFEPEDIEIAKAWLRVDHATEDALLESLLKAATRHIEGLTGRVLIDTTYELTLQCFPSRIVLPKSPVRSVGPIAYVDMAEQDQAFANYRLVNEGDGQTAIIPELGAAWPHPAPGSEVVVTFTAGMSTVSIDDLPDQLKASVLIVTADLYEQRQSGVYGSGSFARIPTGVAELIQPFRRVVV